MARFNEEQLHQVRDERRAQIMNAGLKVFARKGIVGTKMSMISEEAGISKGLLYLYFKSKDELFISIVKEAMESAIIVMEGLSRLSGSPLDKIREMTSAIFNESDKNYFRLIQHAYTSDEVPDHVKTLLDQYSLVTFVDTLMPVFVEGQQAGQLIEEDPRKLISSYLLVLQGLMMIDIDEYNVYGLSEVDILMRVISRTDL